MRTLLAAVILASAIGCGDPPVVADSAEIETESTAAIVTPNSAPDIEDTPHYRALDEILLLMIGMDYRSSGGADLYRRDALRLFLGASNIKAPHDDNPNNPQLEWRLTFPTDEPAPDTFAGWSFVKGRWEGEPTGEFRYGYVPLEFRTMATGIVTSDETVVLSRTAISLAEQAAEAPGGKVFRSEPLVLESGYRCMVEFRRSPDEIETQFRQVVVKFAPVESPAR